MRAQALKKYEPLRTSVGLSRGVQAAVNSLQEFERIEAVKELACPQISTVYTASLKFSKNIHGTGVAIKLTLKILKLLVGVRIGLNTASWLSATHRGMHGVVTINSKSTTVFLPFLPFLLALHMCGVSI